MVRYHKADLANLDQIIYKEGRTKRNRQSLQDSMLSKVKEISDSYDDLFNLVILIKERYHNLGKKEIILENFAGNHCPGVLNTLPPVDFSQLEEFRKQKDFTKELKTLITESGRA